MLTEELKDELNKIFEEPFTDEVVENYGNIYLAALYGDLDADYFLSKGIFIKLMQHEGGEGQGDAYFSVYSFIKNDAIVFIKFYGFYCSYDGASYRGHAFVTPYANVSIGYK